MAGAAAMIWKHSTNDTTWAEGMGVCVCVSLWSLRPVELEAWKLWTSFPSFFPCLSTDLQSRNICSKLLPNIP